MKRYLLMKIGFDTIAVPVETAEQLATVVTCLRRGRIHKRTGVG